jgi:hypothetical protein
MSQGLSSARDPHLQFIEDDNTFLEICGGLLVKCAVEFFIKGLELGRHEEVRG